MLRWRPEEDPLEVKIRVHGEFEADRLVSVPRHHLPVPALSN